MSDPKSYLSTKRDWSWGFCDCTVFVGDWVEESTGFDPCATLRGRYSSTEEANAIVDAHGGLEGLLAAHLEPRFARTADLLDGDVGIVTALTGFEAEGASFKKIPAIRFGPLWGVMSARGAQVKKLDWTGVAWRIA